MNELFCGIDLGIRSSSICIVDEKRQVRGRWSGINRKLSEEVKRYGKELRCVVEAGPLAESVCEEIEGLGASIEVVDSRHTKALLRGKKKTDRIDAQTLAELVQQGWYKPIYRKSGKARNQRTILGTRAAVVNVATRLKNTIRGYLKAHGIVLPASCDGEVFVQSVQAAQKELPTDVWSGINNLLELWKLAHEQQRREYKNLTKMAKDDDVAKRLMTVPGVGPATALGFVATIADHSRFKNPKQVTSYLGLAPRVYQSGATNYHGRITKQGDKLVRWLLIESASCLLTRTKTTCSLKEWGLRLAEKKGLSKAKVAVARRLAILLFTLWRDGSQFSLQPA